MPMPIGQTYFYCLSQAPWFTAKIFNPIAMATGMSNVETLTLTLTKRSTKEAQNVRALDTVVAPHLCESCP
jgi:hypothetical protein